MAIALSLLPVSALAANAAVDSAENEAELFAVPMPEADYTQFVDPFVCTEVNYGRFFPGSVVP